MGWQRHNVDALYGHIIERRLADDEANLYGDDEDVAGDFEKYPPSGDELRDAEIWFLTKDLED